MSTDKSKAQKQFHADPRNEIEQFIFDRLPAITKAYGLGSIKFNFITKEWEDIEDGSIPDDGVFSIRYEPIYKQAFILIAPNALSLYKNEEFTTLSHALIHEVGHIITHRLEKLAEHRHTTQKDIDDTVEETTESIAQIVIKLLAEVDPMFKN